MTNVTPPSTATSGQVRLPAAWPPERLGKGARQLLTRGREWSYANASDRVTGSMEALAASHRSTPSGRASQRTCYVCFACIGLARQPSAAISGLHNCRLLSATSYPSSRRSGRNHLREQIACPAHTRSACTPLYLVGMKRPVGEVQYTIRGVPHDVDRALRTKAARRKLSLNQVIIEELTAITSVRKRADFHDLAGQCTPDPTFDEIMASQRQIDPDKWK